MSQELKPCPFCGSTNIELCHTNISVVCGYCAAEGPFGDADMEVAIESWNSRAEPTVTCRIYGHPLHVCAECNHEHATQACNMQPLEEASKMTSEESLKTLDKERKQAWADGWRAALEAVKEKIKAMENK